jgi:hypothetical protein
LQFAETNNPRVSLSTVTNDVFGSSSLDRKQSEASQSKKSQLELSWFIQLSELSSLSPVSPSRANRSNKLLIACLSFSQDTPALLCFECHI